MVDVHCHEGTDISDPGIIRIINGTDPESSVNAIESANKNSHVWACVGIHPEEINDSRFMIHELKQNLKRLAQNNKVVGVGEVGLDYRQGISETDKNKQKEIFIKMIELAIETGLPIVVHNRNADEDILQMLYAHSSLLKDKILMHCFTRNTDFMDKMADLGAYFSFGGFLLGENNSRVRKAAKMAPEDRILLETDGPFTKTDVKIVASELARARGLTEVKTDQLTSENARRLFTKMI